MCLLLFSMGKYYYLPFSICFNTFKANFPIIWKTIDQFYQSIGQFSFEGNIALTWVKIRRDDPHNPWMQTKQNPSPSITTKRLKRIIFIIVNFYSQCALLYINSQEKILSSIDEQDYVKQQAGFKNSTNTFFNVRIFISENYDASEVSVVQHLNVQVIN